MRRGGRDYWGHRGGEKYGGHLGQDAGDEMPEFMNTDNNNYGDAMENQQDPLDPDIKYYQGGISNDEDDELL
jgi:hypothetical protein